MCCRQGQITHFTFIHRENDVGQAEERTEPVVIRFVGFAYKCEVPSLTSQTWECLLLCGTLVWFGVNGSAVAQEAMSFNS